MDALLFALFSATAPVESFATESKKSFGVPMRDPRAVGGAYWQLI